MINELIEFGGSRTSPKHFTEFRILPGVREAVARLASSLVVVVVTNQPDVARGNTAPGELARITEHLLRELDVAALYVCTHDDADRCECRKPEPGLILRAARELNLDLDRSVFVGDSWRDMEAARRAGIRTCYVGPALRDSRVGVCDLAAASLADAVDLILSSPEGCS